MLLLIVTLQLLGPLLLLLYSCLAQ